MIELPGSKLWIFVYIGLLCLSNIRGQINTVSSTTVTLPPIPTTTLHGTLKTPNNDRTTEAILEKSLLKMFGFTSRPKLRDDAIVPDYLLRLHHDKSKDRSDTTDFTHSRRLLTGSSNTVRSFFHVDSDTDNITDANILRLHFDLRQLPTTEKLSGAELRLYKEWGLQNSEQLYRIDVHDIVKAGRTEAETISRLIDTKFIDTRTTGEWESFDISATVLRWLNAGSKNNEIEVKFLSRDGLKTSDNHLRLRRAAPQSSQDDVANKKRKRKRKKNSSGQEDSASDWTQSRPHLVTYSDDSAVGSKPDQKEQRRRNREERRRRRRKMKDQCRRHKLYVDFNDVGWNDWIVAPPGYHAYYCHGECPMPLADHLNSTNHAIVQNLVNSAYPEAVPKACCVPTELSPISMLYADETGQVVLKTYQEMVVQGCGCR